MVDKKSFLYVHTSVLLFGASGLFAKTISATAILLTLSRALFSSLALYMFIHYRHTSLRLNRIQDYFWNCMAGLFLTIHWYFFILSVQISTVSIGTITFATYPMFVVFIEPYVFKEKFQYKNLISVLMIAIGVAFLIPSFHFNNATTLGIFYGFISSLSFAILSIINRRLAVSYDSAVITLYEQTISACVTTLIIMAFHSILGSGSLNDFINLMIYGVIFTGLAHSLYIQGLKGIKAQTASIISVLEPVYSIFLAILFLNERMTYHEMIGIMFILLAVINGTMMNKEGGYQHDEISRSD